MNTLLRTATFSALCLSLSTAAGCKKGPETDNPDVAAGYRGADNNAYEGEIITADRSGDYEDQGKGISPAVLQNIDDTVLTVYQKDIERCLEDEMGERETRFMRAVFLIEFTINTQGDTTAGKVLEIGLREQDAKGTDKGEVDPANMKACIESSVTEWAFDPPPEVDYVHTYRGQVGEAF